MVKDIEMLTQGLGTILWLMMIQNFEQESDKVRKIRCRWEWTVARTRDPQTWELISMVSTRDAKDLNDSSAGDEGWRLGMREI